MNPGSETIAQLWDGTEGQGPKRPTPPKPPQVSKPEKPIPPMVPGAKPGNVGGVDNGAKEELSEEEVLRNYFKRFWFEMKKKSVGR